MQDDAFGCGELVHPMRQSTHAYTEEPEIDPEVRGRPTAVGFGPFSNDHSSAPTRNRSEGDSRDGIPRDKSSFGPQEEAVPRVVGHA